MDKIDDKGFQNAWFSSYAAKPERTAADALSDVRDFAYASFDRLDINKNGFVEMAELKMALHGGSLSERERSFVSFILNNHDQIADSFDEGGEKKCKGISRQDLDAYFTLVLNLL